MNKKALILGLFAVIILAIGGGFWRWEKVRKQKEDTKIETQISEKSNIEENQQVQKSFIVDVDPDVDHWQIQGENEAFTIKFPKEWYWLKSNREKTGYYSQIITNNPHFDMIEYADIGVFSDIGPHSPLMLSNDTEIIITNRGFATSNAGTPQDGLDSIFELAKRNYPSVKCRISNNKTIPFTAYCSAVYDSQLQQSYYVINDKLSLTVTARTTKDTLVKKEILDKIVRSIVLK